MTQAEVARVVGAGGGPTVSLWESGEGVLRHHYCEYDGDWAATVAALLQLGDRQRADLRQIEDAVYGLRWLEQAHGLRFDLRRSLVPQLPLVWLA